MALPFLPGNAFNGNIGKVKFHKSHHFDYNNEVSMLVGESKPGIGGETLLGQKVKPRNSTFPSGEGTSLPAWVAFDRQVLCFDAYYQEAVHEHRQEQYRVRQCKIYFYLEDDSIQVIEPRSKNSGIPQGTLIRRHRIPKPLPHDDDFYTVEDFNLDQEICLYSKVFHITGCDEFTNNFLRKLGVRQPNSKDIPGDPYHKYRKALDESMQPLRPYEKHDTLKQFLDHDRHVLRFSCYWDDTDSMFGDVREMVLHYFLADDTIEIREVIRANSGRDAAPMFLRRGKLPKNVEDLCQPGETTDRTVLNVFGPTGHGGRYILDSLKTGAVHIEFYIDSDLTIGSVLNVWGRRLLICDCDDFTKDYYRSKFGVDTFLPVEYKNASGASMPREFPPYNGFGSEEDSLCSCLGLLPKPPKRDFIKFMEKDRHGLDSNVLRFLARMDTSKPIDMDRRFIISYFLSDDTTQVYEPPVRNSGIIGGKFLERGRVKKPDQPLFGTSMSEYYLASDLYVGATVLFNKFPFILIDADNYAFHYMEQHANEMPKSDIDLIMKRLQSKAEKFNEMMNVFSSQESVSGSIPYDRFRSLLLQIDPMLVEHDIITVSRFFAQRSSDSDEKRTRQLIATVQDELRKKNFEMFGRLIEGLVQLDKNRSGQLHAEVVRNIFLSHHVPIAKDLVREIIRLCVDEQGMVPYEEVVRIINWRDHPVPITERTNMASSAAEEWSGTKSENSVQSIDYNSFIRALAGKPEQESQPQTS